MTKPGKHLHGAASRKSPLRRAAAFACSLILVGTIVAVPCFAWALDLSDEAAPQTVAARTASRAAERAEATLYADGVVKTVEADGRTVADILETEGILLADRDRVVPAEEEPVLPGATVTVYRVSVARVTVTETVPRAVERRPSQYIEKGEERILQAGGDGSRTVTYEVTTENGAEASRRVLSETWIKAPVTEIVEYGSGGTIVTEDGEVLSFTRKIDAEATAYTTEGLKWKTTATGTTARVGAIAVDPKTIPLGTMVYVSAPDGESWVYGTARCEDTGGAIKGNIIDLFFDTRSECFRFGRRAAALYILESE